MSNFSSCIYSGLVIHKRFKPKKHFFSYKTFSLLINLNEIEDLQRKIKFFSYNKFNILSFYNIDHGPRNGSSLTKWVKKNLNKAKININGGTIKLFCFPRFFGYVFNPLSIFYCYDKHKKLRAVLYEVKNTFNEQHTYLFKSNPSSKLILHKCSKKFYVSPFIEMNTFYNFRLTEPNENIRILIKQTDKVEKVLVACQIGRKQSMSLKQLLINLFTYPMMTFKIMILIHYEALRLWKKGAIFKKKQNKIKNNISLEK